MYEDGGAYYTLASAQVTSAPISCLKFDLHEEAAWYGCSNGWFSQVGVPSLERVCATKAHAGPVLDARSLGASCLSLSSRELVAHSSGGAIRQSIRSNENDFACMELYRGGSQVLIGMGSSGIVAYDLVSAKSTGQWDCGGAGVVALHGPLAGGAFLAASPDGKIAMLDSRSRSVRHGSVLTAHIGGFAAACASGTLVATSGYSVRGGHPLLERAVKVFDVRMAPRQLCAIPFGAGPTLLQFHPRMPTTLLVGSASGALSLVDADGYGAGMALTLDLGDDASALTCLDFTSTGECIGFGTAGGWMHVLAAGVMPSVAGQGAEPHAPPSSNPPASVPLEEGDPLSHAPLYYNEEGPHLLSSLRHGERVGVGLPPRVIDPTLLPLIKWSDFVGVLKNPVYDPVKPAGTGEMESAKLRNMRVRSAAEPADLAARRAQRAQRRAAEGGVVLPEKYLRVQVASQQAAQAQSWFQEFDYSAFNHSGFVGLENDLANAYCNALVQALFFVPGMRAALLSHVPRASDEFCLAGELSLLFRMLRSPGAVVCRAANLLRALRQSPQALALGLVEGVAGERGAGDIEVEATKERSLSRRVQALSRFLLEALHRELGQGAGGVGGAVPSAAAGGASPTPVEAVFGMPVRSELSCLAHPSRAPQVRDSLSFQADLGPSPAPGTNLAAALETALCSVATMRAWFDAEVKYTAVQQRRAVTLPPRVLLVNCGDAAGGRLAWWKAQSGAAHGALPPVLAFSRREGGQAGMHVAQGDGLGEMAGPGRLLYELVAVVSHISDMDEAVEATEPHEGHLIAHIKVPRDAAAGPPDPDRGGGAPGSVDRELGARLTLDDGSPRLAPSDWVLFNDFRVERVPAAEVGELYEGQKVPCLLFYARRAMGVEGQSQAREEARLLSISPAPILTPLGFQELCRLPPLGSRSNLHAPTFLPLGPDEMPRRGMLLALDAEFVSYSPPQYSTVRGVEVVNQPSRLGLARVSVVRGEGPLAGACCIDDYIRSAEEVHDYLTRYSGIVPGDLDPAHSPHCLTTMRRAYLKLRYLVDVGVIFVGHGLKQDFRMINIIVHPSQIVDTVKLYHKPRMRQLSLRFLASYLLRTSIQSGNHDSIEDAHTALRLYTVYLELEAKGLVSSTLDEIYNWGKTYGWEPVVWKGDVPQVASTVPVLLAQQ